MKKGSKKINSKKLIIIFLCLAVFFAVLAVILHETTKITNESYENCALGDVNGDGYINSMDALLVIESTADNQLLFDNQKKHADVNCDGRIDSSDSLILLEYAVGEIKTLPYKNSTDKNIEFENSANNGKSADCNSAGSYSTVQIVNEWDNGDGTYSYQFSITVKNISDKELAGWKTEIALSSKAKITNNWDCESKIKSNTITVSGKSVSKGSAATCGLIVSAPEGLQINSIKTAD